MSSETIPEWAMEEAERILRHAEAPPTDGNLHMMSRALLDAEQRGLEKAAEECDRFAKVGVKLWAEADASDDRAQLHLAQSHGAQSCADAIRSLGDKT